MCSLRKFSNSLLLFLIPFVTCLATSIPLSPVTAPTTGEPGVTLINITGSDFPSGTITPALVRVTLNPAVSGSGPLLNGKVTAVTTIIGETRRITFQIMPGKPVLIPTKYLVSVSGSTSSGALFASSNTATLIVDPPASIVSLNPGSAQPGQSVAVTISGKFSNFFQGSTQASFGPGISVGGAPEGTLGPVTVSSHTSAIASLTIDPNATPGPRDVNVRTGSELASLPNGFTVSNGASVLTLVNPSSGLEGQQNLSVNLTGQFTNWVQGTTTATFGTGITVNSLTINSATTAAAVLNIDLSATLGPRDVTMTTGSEVATLSGGFTVTGPVPIISSLSPGTGLQSQPLPVTITGQFTSFLQGTTVASFGDGISVGGGPSGGSGPVTVNSPTNATAQLVIDPAATVGARTVTVQTGIEIESATNGFTVAPLIGPTWIQLQPPGVLPPSREDPAVYDPSSDRLISFGGAVTTGASNDTWVLTNANGLKGTPSWIKLNPNGSLPPARFANAAVYNPGSNRLIIFGGAATFGLGNDVWVLSNANGLGGNPAWTQLSPTGTPPSPRRYFSAVYDPSSNRMILFGGCTCVGSNDPQATNDVWVLTNADGTEVNAPSWIQLTPIGTLPAARDAYVLAYDNTTNRMIIFGGFGDVPSFSLSYNDVWVLSNANGLGVAPTWVLVSPDGATGSPPFVDATTGGIYNPSNNHLTIVGGSVPSSAITAVWVLQNANGLGGSPNWTQLSPTGGPPEGRDGGAIIYDVSSDRLTIFGGENQPLGTLLNDTWVLTSATSIPGTVSSLLSAVPNSGKQGQQNLSVDLTGQLTHFTQGSTQVSFGAGITVGTTTVMDATHLNVQITIDPAAAVGVRTVTATTGTEVVSLLNGFTVTVAAAVPIITGVSPNTGQQGQQNLSVTISGQFTHFVQGTSAVSFGSDITVSGVMVASATSLSASITIPATANLEGHTVTVSTGTELASLANGFTVQAGKPALVAVNPNSAQPGQVVSVAITGVFTHFAAGTSTVSLASTDITINSVTVASPSNLTVNLTLAINAQPGPRTVTVTTGTEVVSLTGGFTIQAACLSGKEPGVRIADVAGGEFLPLANGTLRLYSSFYGANPLISFVSSDGIDWTQEAGLRQAAPPPIIGASKIMQLPNGSYRMYYPSDPDVIDSAVSADGLTWVQEPGDRVSGPGPFSCVHLGNPDVVEFPGGLLRMYYSCGINEGFSGGPILSSTSTDGLNWTLESGIRLAAGGNNTGLDQILGDPRIQTLPDGSYRMYYTGLVTPTTNQISELDSIFSAVSADGLIWANEKGIRLSRGAPGSPDSRIADTPKFIGMPDGTFRLYYTGYDDNVFPSTLSAHWCTIGPDNPPAVVAGSNQTIVLPANTVALSGFASDDGLPAGATLTYLWTMVSGPGTVTFSSPTSLATNAQFSSVGQYVLRLTVSDTQLLGFDDLTITLQSSPSPVILSVAPNVGTQGGSPTITITGGNTNFVQGTTTATFGAGITVVSLTVKTSTTAVAVVNIDPAAALGARDVTLTTGSEIATLSGGFMVTAAVAVPLITSVSPNSGPQGQGGPVAITGQNTHFVQGTTQVDFGAGITVSNISVTCPTCLTVQLQISATATPGPRTVTVTTGSEVVSLADGFTVQPGTPIIASFGPTSAQQGQTVALTVNGQFTHFAQGTTQVSLGTGVTVSNIIVSSATSLTAQIAIDPSAAVGTRTLTVTTGSEVVSVANVFTVQLATPILLTLNPGGGQQGQQNLSVAITGFATHFAQGTSQASFGAGVAIVSLTVTSLTAATAVVDVDPAAALGTRTVTITTGSEVASFTNGFTISAAIPSIVLVNPNSGQQGQQNESVAITGQFTHWVQGTTTASFGAGIIVASLTVSSPTTAMAAINVNAAAPVSSRDVTLTTGSEIATLPGGFNVTSSSPAVSQLSPNTGQQGQQNLQITITGQSTHFVQGMTTASFGAGITVASLTINSATTATVVLNIDPTAAPGARNVTFTTGAEVATLNNGFTITNGSPVITQISPNSSPQGLQNLSVQITGQFTHFTQATTQVSFGTGGVTVNSVSVTNAGSLTANISIALNQTPGSLTVTVTTGTEVVSLPNGFTVQQAINQPPVITMATTWSVTLPNRLTITYGVADDGLPIGGALTVAWQTISGPGNVGFQNQTLVCVSCPPPGVPGSVNTTGSVSVGFDQAGTYVLQISASDSQLTAMQNVTVTVSPSVGPPPTVAITSPTEGTEVTAPISVTGTVTSAALASWTLEFRMQTDSLFRPLATGTTQVTNAVLGTFDPTLLLNGIALIQLRAIDTSGQTTIAGPVSVVVTRNLKVGNFTVSFNDLTVPVAGLPIQVIRTYDSRNKALGDFGVGWKLDLSTVTLSTNGALGANWTGTSSGGLLPNLCIEPTQSHVVVITFNDGTVFQFQPTLNPSCQQVEPLAQTTMNFAPISTTPSNASLTLIGNNQPFVDGNFPGLITLLGQDDATVLDPDGYQLTMPDGRVLVLSVQNGLQSITDLNGNTLTVTPAGITHSSGKGVSFQRDTLGRITQITDPNGNILTYVYDGNGNLVSNTDRSNNTSTYTYDSLHNLLTIVDPRGVQPIKNVYDSNGRLIQHIDAFGHVINYTNDLADRQEIVTDRLGNVTVNEYDSDGNIVQVTDAAGGVTKRTYDSRDNLLTETNPLNETRTYTYDSNNNRLTETDPLSHTTTYTYNSRNQVLTITDALGRVTTNTYDTNGNLLSTQDAASNVTTYTYNASGLRISTTDPLGSVTAYQYDGPGDLTQQTDALGNITTYTYDGDGNRLTETKTRTTTTGSQTLLTKYQYDASNRVTQTTYADGSTTQTQYNSIGKQSVTTDQLGRQTSYSCDLMGRLLQTTYPDNTNESSTYDAEGDRISSTDRGGRTTSYTYDQLKRLTQTTFADGAANKTAYDAASEVVSVTDQRGNVTQYAYDTTGRRTSVTDALSHVTSFTYDAVGNQLLMTDANGNTTHYQYDVLNRRTRVTYADNTFDSTGYDALGRTVSKTDEAGATTLFQYDKLGRLTQVTDAASQLTKYTYDEVGNRITQTDANNHTTTFAYDQLGRRTIRTLPLGMSETYAYDLAGNLKSKTDFDGKTTTYSYDALNRLTSKTPDASFSAPTVSFTYTATGQRQSMSDASGLTSYTYDQRDRLTQKAAPEGTLTYTYDLAGDLTSMRSSNSGGTSVNYSYDALNRLSTVKDNRLTAGTTTYAYDNVGNLQGYLYPNNVKTTYAYNTLNRLTNVSIGTGSTLASYAYTLGPAGNRTQVTEMGGRQVSYTYDALYRLTGETITGGSVNGAIGYQYDAVGNRLKRTSTVPPVPAATYTYDPNDRLSTDMYDQDGNTTASGGNTYGYDFENHLTTQNTNAVALLYDGDGNRVAKTAGSVTTTYLVDDRNLTGYAQVLEEITGGTVQRVYTYGLNRISQSQASGTSFYEYDGQGSVRLLTDTTGAVTDRYDYDAFGNIISQAGGTPNVYLYSGEQSDPNLGFYYLRARYYNNSTGRLVTTDPRIGDLFDPMSLHRYVYANNNPVMLSDPSGQETLVELSTTLTIAALIQVNSGVYGTISQEILGKVAPSPGAVLKDAAINAVIGTVSGLAGLYVGTLAQGLEGAGYIAGGASGFVGQVLKEFEGWSTQQKPIVLKDALGRVAFATFAGFGLGGFFANIELSNTILVPSGNAFQVVRLPPYPVLVPIEFNRIVGGSLGGIFSLGLAEILGDAVTNYITEQFQ
jgi:RHS repeat-associated protein